MRPSVLTIAGSDSGGGAGIQADLKTFAAHRVHGLSAITALTAQNTRRVVAVHVPDVGFLAEQIDACFEDFDIAAIKLGMLASSDVIHAVADALERNAPAPVVLDPVMVATSGASLLAADAVVALRERLFPLAVLVTPNIPEAEILASRSIANALDVERAAHDLLQQGCRAVLIKGGHLDLRGDIVDLLALTGGRIERFSHPRLSLRAHGTGCTLAASIAANLALGLSLVAACARAGDYVHRALVSGYRPGHGSVTVLDHFGAAP